MKEKAYWGFQIAGKTKKLFSENEITNMHLRCIVLPSAYVTNISNTLPNEGPAFHWIVVRILRINCIIACNDALDSHTF